MEILRLLKRCIIRPRSKHISSLESLPNEILQHINTFLPLPAAAAFALCSQRLYFVLGTGSWEKLARTQQQRDKERQFNGKTYNIKLRSWDDFRDPPPQGQREEFLSLLERDLPKLIFCCQCSLLHPANLRYERYRLCSRSQPMHNLYFTKIQMTMKRHRLGRDYSRQLKWFSSSYTYPPYKSDFATHKIVEARIAGGKFLVRVQYWVVLPASAVHLTSSATIGAHVCEHIHGLRTVKGSLEEMLNCRMSHWRDQDHECPECSGLRQCPHCETEFRIDARELEPRGFTIVITTWWNLGPGISPYDREYREHCNLKRSLFDIEPQVEFPVGSIQGVFENHQEFSIDSLLEANRRSLIYPIKYNFH